LLSFLLLLLSLYFFRFNFEMDSFRISRNNAFNAIVFVFVLIVESGEGFELEVRRASIEEALLRELIATSVDYAHGNVVVSIHADDLAPKE
jgi:hypothetical protein